VTDSLLDAQRKQLKKLRDEAAVRVAGEKPTTSLESIEWKKMHVYTRSCLLLFAGVDGDLEALASRDWHELPQPERVQIVLGIRSLRAELLGLVALARHQ
jgi:hypothetical protein